MLSIKKLAHFALLLGSSASTTLPLSRRSSNANAMAPMVSTEYGTVFDVEATTGGQSIQLLVDSGSSDVYMMRTGFTCLDKETGLQLADEECGYDLTRTYTVSGTYERYPTRSSASNTAPAWRAGSWRLRRSPLHASLSLDSALQSPISRRLWETASIQAAGVGYPSLISAHPSNLTDNTTYWFHQLPYKSILVEMYEQGLIREP